MGTTSNKKTLVLIKILFLFTTLACNDFMPNEKSKVAEKTVIQHEMGNQIINKNNADCDIKVSLILKDNNSLETFICIKNKTKQTIYLFNRLYTEYNDDDEFAIDKNIFYTYIDENDLLYLVKAIIPVPSGLNVEKEIIPCCTKILSGETFEESLEIELPINLYAPYTKKKENLKKQYPVVFRFGYFLGHENTESMEIKIPTKYGEVMYFDPFDYNYQEIIEVGPFIDLPVSK
jgi:hypothetical protein